MALRIVVKAQPRWRIERQKRPNGTLRLLSAGTGEDRRSITLGLVEEDAAERYRRGMQLCSLASQMLEEQLGPLPQFGAVGDMKHLGVEDPEAPHMSPEDVRFYHPDYLVRYARQGDVQRQSVLAYLWEIGGWDGVGDVQTKDQAVHVLRQVGASQLPVDHGSMSLRDYVKTVWTAERKRKRADFWKSTEEGFWRNHLLPALGHVPMRELSAKLFDEFLEKVRTEEGREASGSMKNSLRNAYRQCLMFAQRREHIKEVHAFYRIEGATRRVRPAPKPLSGDEVKALVAEAPTSGHRALFAFLFDQGPRPSEAIRLDWSHVSWTRTERWPDGTVEIPGKKTERAHRLVPLMPMAREQLEALWNEAGQPTEGPVFTWRGKAYKATNKATFRSALRSTAERAGLDPERVFPYLGRHTVATEARRSGVPKDQLAAFLGHSDPTMLDRHYDHTEVAEVVDARLFPDRRK